MNHAHDLLESVLISFEQIGNNDGDASTDPCHAVNEDVGLFSCFFNEIIGLTEMLTEVVGFVIFSRDIEVVLDLLFFVSE